MVLAELRSDGGPLHPGLLAARTGLHVSTVRRHLQGLEASGLVEHVAEDRRDPGRPRMLYRATTSPGEGLPVCVGYRFVAESLARWLEASSDDPRAVASEIGDAWGRHLVHAPPLTHTERAEAIEHVLVVLADLGYAPSRVVDGGRRLELGRCPFQQLSDSPPRCRLRPARRASSAGRSRPWAPTSRSRVARAPNDPSDTCVVRLETVPPRPRGR